MNDIITCLGIPDEALANALLASDEHQFARILKLLPDHVIELMYTTITNHQQFNGEE